MGIFDKLKEFITEESPEDEQGYAEIEEYRDLGDKRLVIKIFDIKQEADVKNVLNELREGKTIALINRNITLSDQQVKSLISRLKKTCDAIGGDIVGLSDSLFVATPNLIKIERERQN